MKQIFKQLVDQSTRVLATPGSPITTSYTTEVVDLSLFDEAVLFTNITSMTDGDKLQLSKIEFANNTAMDNGLVSFEVNQPYPFGNNTFAPVGSGEFIFYPKTNVKKDALIEAVITKADVDASKPFAKGRYRLIGIQLNNYPFGKFARFTFTASSTVSTASVVVASISLGLKGQEY